MVEKRGLFKALGRDLLQNLAIKIGLSVFDGNLRNDVNEE